MYFQLYDSRLWNILIWFTFFYQIVDCVVRGWGAVFGARTDVFRPSRNRRRVRGGDEDWNIGRVPKTAQLRSTHNIFCKIRSEKVLPAPKNSLNRPSNREFVMNDLWHYLFQKTDYPIRREVGHRVIVSCFGQRNLIYKFVINI